MGIPHEERIDWETAHNSRLPVNTAIPAEFHDQNFYILPDIAELSTKDSADIKLSQALHQNVRDKFETWHAIGTP